MPYTKKIALEEAGRKLNAGIYNQKRGANVNRIYDTISSAPAILTKALKVRGQKLVEVDIKACHPTLLATICPPTERRAYEDFLLTQDFYALSSSHRETAKLEFCQWAFGNRKWSIPLGRGIAARFGSLAFAVRERSGAELAREMQNLEAAICIDAVGARLMAEGLFFVSKHDAFLCLPSEAARVAEIVAEEFKRVTGTKASVRTKR